MNKINTDINFVNINIDFINYADEQNHPTIHRGRFTAPIADYAD